MGLSTKGVMTCLNVTADIVVVGLERNHRGWQRRRRRAQLEILAHNLGGFLSSGECRGGRRPRLGWDALEQKPRDGQVGSPHCLSKRRTIPGSQLNCCRHAGFPGGSRCRCGQVGRCGLGFWVGDLKGNGTRFCCSFSRVAVLFLRTGMRTAQQHRSGAWPCCVCRGVPGGNSRPCRGSSRASWRGFHGPWGGVVAIAWQASIQHTATQTNVACGLPLSPST